MNYKKIYDDIINKRQKEKLNKKDGYCEKHHIVPRSLGGSNKKDNLVNLTAREHYICHWLLTKMYEEGSPYWIKMVNAFQMLAFSQSNAHDNNRYMPARRYEYFKTQFSKAQSINQSGDNNSNYGMVWIYNEDFQQSKKVQSVDVQTHLDAGWIKGRVVDWLKVKKADKIKSTKKPVFVCPVCGSEYLLLKTTCSKSCYYIFRHRQSKINAIELFEDFKMLEFKSVTKYAEYIGSSQPRLTKLWNKYIPEYSLNKQHGKAFKT